MTLRARCLSASLRLAVGSLLVVQGCATIPSLPGRSRDLPMLYQVDEGLYRGGQPSLAGIRQLGQMGIKTIVCLRQPSLTVREERRLAEQLGMRWVSLPMWFWWRPSEKQIRKFLAVAEDPASRPVFVHCRQGWNRAGIMVAIYRMVYHGWPARQAYAEARQFGLVPWNLASRHLLFREVPRKWASAAPAAFLPPSSQLSK